MERNNLWAPWRIKYIQGLSDEKYECFLCFDRDNPEEDRENLVLWRSQFSFAVFNRFPYNNGHLLVAPKRHIPDFAAATQEELTDFMLLARDVQIALKDTINCHGFNVGINIGRCAGAGVPDHLHMHVVPRWDGDTNYMAVCSDTDVISQSMEELYEQLENYGNEKSLPSANFTNQE